jgi:energy-coupling factor transporter transmembrane protein EcfT
MPHPSVRLFLWVGLVGCLQVLDLMGLLVAAAVLFPISVILAGKRFLRLVKRVRWLVLSLAVLFAWVTPGNAIAPALGMFGPTVDGLSAAGSHCMRLLVMLALLAVLLETTATPDLVGGLYTLLAPLARTGVFRGRIALRLLLVLRYVEEPAHAPARRNWRHWLQFADEDRPGEAVILRHQPLTAADWLIVIVTGIALAGILGAWGALT